MKTKPETKAEEVGILAHGRREGHAEAEEVTAKRGRQMMMGVRRAVQTANKRRWKELRRKTRAPRQVCRYYTHKHRTDFISDSRTETNTKSQVLVRGI
jgi:hypothetical protein